MSRSVDEVGFVTVREGLDLTEQDVAWSDADIDANGILTVRTPNVLVDLEGAGIKTLRGIRFLDGNGDPVSNTAGVPPPIVGPITLAARRSGGDPSLAGLTFEHLTCRSKTESPERRRLHSGKIFLLV